jgi:hypothetical protein
MAGFITEDNHIFVVKKIPIMSKQEKKKSSTAAVLSELRIVPVQSSTRHQSMAMYCRRAPDSRIP